jgi:raffinose synthase
MTPRVSGKAFRHFPRYSLRNFAPLRETGSKEFFDPLTLFSQKKDRNMEVSLEKGILEIDGKPVLAGVSPGFLAAADPQGAGVFLTATAGRSNSFHSFALGRIEGMRRFTSCYREESFWMKPASGTAEAEVRAETQWLLAETESGGFVMLVPLLSGSFRFSLCGQADGLALVAETGDPFTHGSGGEGLFVAVGPDPYSLSARGARSVRDRLGTGALRADKPVPDFADAFGWCTWDAFYREVSAEKVKEGLSTFAAGGVEPRFLILDDGWQSYEQQPTGEERLTAFEPNDRFGGDLAPTIRMARQDFKVRTFLVWHSMIGYWSGVDGAKLPGYGVRDVPRAYGPGILRFSPGHNCQWWGALAGLVSPGEIGRFFDDYHALLRSQGVDGVKVDNQAVLEALGTGIGGRIPLYRAYRKALEQSVRRHFSGRLINCMANAMETYYGSPDSTLMRTSIDFWPLKPETHGEHLRCNAQVGVWFGEFMRPDWDMFQSGHPMGAFHAAGRAVSGGPVYVSDRPGTHDFVLLRKLVLSDGSVLRADGVGRPTLDCLFSDVTRDPVLLKVFNTNRDCAVIGVFNANHHADEADRTLVTGDVGAGDVPGLAGGEFAALSQRTGRVWRCALGDRTPVTLAEGDWEIVSFAPVDRGFAALGLADKFNSTGAIAAKEWTVSGACAVSLRDGGEFVAWAGSRPSKVESGGSAIDFAHDPATGRFSVSLPADGPRTVLISW